MKVRIAIWIFLIIIGGVFVLSNNAIAHPGGTDAYGCHTCRSNCSSWGLSYGEYHCHQSKGLVQPESPVTCSYGIGCEYAPEYESPSYNFPSFDYPKIPSCTSNAYYDSISDSCKCYSGYIASGGKCISEDDYCQDLLGYNANYNILTDDCECRYGYVISGGRCVDGDTVCHDKYGYYSSYDSLSKNCKCDYGYVFNSSNQCVSEDDYCQDLFGFNAEYNILTDKCACKSGYLSLDNMCVEGDTYCRNQYGTHSSYESLVKNCVCDSGYKFKNNNCVAPEISRISLSEVEVGEEITVQGENFGDSKYENFNLYVGSTKVSLLDISRWQDDKIIFGIGDYLESGYVYLRNSTLSIKGSYLNISKPEEGPVVFYQPIVKKPESPSGPSPKKLPSETQLVTKKVQPDIKIQQKDDSQKSQEVIQKSNEQNKKLSADKKITPKKNEWIFLANISNSIKNFFSKIFR